MLIVLTRRTLRRAAFAALVLAAVAWFLAYNPWKVTEEYLPAVASMQAAQAVPADLRPVYSVKTDEKVVALTFDISWGEKMAPKVLDILRERGIRATFFLSGPWARNHEELVKRIVADGHEIASHGQRHDNFSSMGADGVAQNIRAAHVILVEMTGTQPRLLRPPNGDFNRTSLAATRGAGYQTIMWSVDSLDWKNPGVEVIRRRVVELAHPGAIVLMHASDSCKLTDRALPGILDGLKSKGFATATVGELLARHQPDPNGCIRVPGRPNC